jgi:exosortase
VAGIMGAMGDPEHTAEEGPLAVRAEASATGRERLLAAGLVLAFAPALPALARSWAATEYQSHGFLVPVVAGWIAWAGRARRRRLPRAADGRGAFLLAASILLYAASLAVRNVSGEALAGIGSLAGLVWWCRGLRWLRALAFPIGFLLFMVPIPPEWLTPVVVQLMLFVSSASVAVLHGLGFAVAREGNVLVLGSGQSLFVAEACSGLTSLVTLAPIAVLVAWASPVRAVRKGVLVASVVPIAMGANLVRVVATAIGAEVWSARAVTEEPAHALFGLVVYAAACVGLVGLERLLRRNAPPPGVGARITP